jgi:hypothetical protein
VLPLPLLSQLWPPLTLLLLLRPWVQLPLLCRSCCCRHDVAAVAAAAAMMLLLLLLQPPPAGLGFMPNSTRNRPGES